MVEIKIERKKEYKAVKWQWKGKIYKPEDSTISDVSIIKDGNVILKCYCCENGGESTDIPRKDKRVVARKYFLYKTQSNVSLPKKYKPNCISTYSPEAPNHINRRIHLHIGNCPQNTEGCFLFGMVDNKNGTIGQSTIAVEKIYDICFKEGLENCYINLIELPNN